MSGLRFFAVILIFAAVSVAWLILGGTLEYRTAQLTEALSQEVNSLWGPSGLTQNSPVVASPGAASGDGAVGLLASDVKADFVHNNRYRGLLWFSTYTVQFAGRYTVCAAPRAKDAQPAHFLFYLPAEATAFEALTLTLDDKPQDGVLNGTTDQLGVVLPPDGARHSVIVSYRTRGRDRWLYSPATEGGHGLIRNFTLTAGMNFADIDYPRGSVSPIQPAEFDGGKSKALWRYDNIRMNQPMGIEMPAQRNAGPIAARMAFFAPVSLFFFCTVLFTVVVLKRIPLHPMHYLFISAGFFAFHILMAYLVDIINIHLAFWMCAGVSVLLVVTYMRLVAGIRFAVLYAGLAQLVYLVGFSYAFFWVGKTGLSITIGAIATLFVLMQATGRVNWQEVFRKPSPGGFVPPPLPGGTVPAGPPAAPPPGKPIDVC